MPDPGTLRSLLKFRLQFFARREARVLSRKILVLFVGGSEGKGDPEKKSRAPLEVRRLSLLKEPLDEAPLAAAATFSPLVSLGGRERWRERHWVCRA